MTDLAFTSNTLTAIARFIAATALGAALALTNMALPTSATPVSVASFDFPNKLLAQILYEVPNSPPGPGGTVRMGRVLARGHFVIPRNAPLHLYLKADSVNNMQFIEKLKGLPVKVIEASGLDIEDKHLAFFKDFHNLKDLNLCGSYITDQGLESICRFSHLTQLRVSRSNIRGETFKKLSALKDLDIFVCGNTVLKKGSLPTLKPILPQLVNLDLGHTGMTKEDARALQFLDKIERLDLSANTDLDNSIVPQLAHCKHLQFLHVEDTAITSKCLAQLQKIASLQTVYVRRKQFWPAYARPPRDCKFKIEDIADHSDATMDILMPLH